MYLPKTADLFKVQKLFYYFFTKNKQFNLFMLSNFLNFEKNENIFLANQLFKSACQCSNDYLMYILKIQILLKSRGSGPAVENKAEKRFLLCLCFDALFACVVVGDSVNKSFFSCNGSFHFSSISSIILSVR